MIDVLLLGGTGFGSGGDGVTEAFMAALDPSSFNAYVVSYPGAFGGAGMSWHESKAAGRQALINALHATENRCVIGGFSQGAGIAGDLAAEIGRWDLGYLRPWVLGAALLADPSRPPGGSFGDERVAPGYGIAGAREIQGVPAFWAAAERDPITSLPKGSPLRTLPDVLDLYTLRSPGEALEWGLGMVDAARANRFQRWWDLGNVREWNGAVGQMRDYLPPPLGGGRHGPAYVREGLAVRLAEHVNRMVA